jgi:hypothetical protein
MKRALEVMYVLSGMDFIDLQWLGKVQNWQYNLLLFDFIFHN